ncbi:enoyl-CoA hydratase family protein [Streptomyces somaliensis]|uniref:enoyl-CoA hydratase family protein n=1 Tax=Streptomyces somaliensis TaxID=78355 RepID=UPI0020CCFC57|nr:enoyl-CoA hydratase family protein [Streptomyces somaliensis]MCP9944237.1 enoyl-CoA hydratase family protein [Streptomyces somaliensis]MCP9962529.1 enoyl-CoA hydratase family protein [Streptomyces somaliensis]MCP9975354.1 enoyl-CoA hydratase family protein [Streptomyces somaliensis]
MSLVTTARDRAVATLTLNAPGSRNALSARLVAELAEALDDCAEDPAVRAVVLTHTGSDFCTGADLKAPPSPYAFVTLLRRIVELPKPVVARVAGRVRAGGVGLVAACDLVVVSEEADFALTEVRVGAAPALVSLTLLPRLDQRAAARYYLTGECFGAAEAARIGLVTTAAPDVDEALAPLLDALRKGSPRGLAASKRLVTARVLESFDRDAEDLVQRSASLFASAEAREGMAAFLERRDPAWAV